MRGIRTTHSSKAGHCYRYPPKSSGKQEKIKSETEIGTIVSALTAHMVLPAGDAKPSWESAARTISISDFRCNLSGTSYLQGNGKQQGFQKWAVWYSGSKDQAVYQLSQNVLFLHLWTFPYVIQTVWPFQCLGLICCLAKKAPNTGPVFISFLFSGGEPLIGTGADGDWQSS